MAKNQTRRLPPGQLQADREGHIALQSFGDYSPANPAYTRDKIDTLLATMQAMQEAEINAANALAAARDAAVAAEWDFHNAMLGIKDQIIAQYGVDADQVQSLGLKKKSEHKRPTPAKAQTN
jgi:hypothetical protein